MSLQVYHCNITGLGKKKTEINSQFLNMLLMIM